MLDTLYPAINLYLRAPIALMPILYVVVGFSSCGYASG